MIDPMGGIEVDAIKSSQVQQWILSLAQCVLNHHLNHLHNQNEGIL